MKRCYGPLCERESEVRGLCIAHYYQQNKGKDLTPLRIYRKRPVAPEGYSFCNHCEAFKKDEDFYRLANGKTRALCTICHNKQTYENEKTRKKETV